MSLSLVLPAAGRGKRFQDAGIRTPKPLIRVGDFPMILWALSNFSLESNDEVWIVCQREHSMESKLSEFTKNLNFSINYIHLESISDGPASTLLLALNKVPIDLPIISANSDQYVVNNLVPFIELVRKREGDGQILTMKASGNAWSYVGRDESGKIDQIVEKRQISEEATVGIYGWSSAGIVKDSIEQMIERNERVNNEFYVAPSYNRLVQSGKSIRTLDIGNHATQVNGLGTPEDLSNFISRADFKYLNQKVKLFLKI